jgi:RNA polymerase sigma-70 factor (ECF subfamily)
VATASRQEDSSVSGPDSLRSLVQRALDLIRGDFDEPTWQAFWATAVEEQNSTEVAARLGVSANAVRKSKARVLRRLRLELTDLI